MNPEELDLERLARAEIAKRYGGVITFSEFIGLQYIDKNNRSEYLNLCSSIEQEYIIIEKLNE